MPIHDFRLFTAHPDAADRETGKTLPLRNSRFLEQGEGAAARPKKHKASVDRAFRTRGFVPDSDLPAPSWLTLQLERFRVWLPGNGAARVATPG